MVEKERKIEVVEREGSTGKINQLWRWWWHRGDQHGQFRQILMTVVSRGMEVDITETRVSENVRMCENVRIRARDESVRMTGE